MTSVPRVRATIKAAHFGAAFYDMGQNEMLKKNFKPIASVAGSSELHKCRRCHRTLPWDQFGSLRMFSMKVKQGRAMLLHPFCFKCREQRKGQHVEHALYSPKLDRFITDRVMGTKAAAPHRGIAFAIDKDDVLGVYLDQNGRCAISGAQMTFDWYEAPTHASLDRIDSEGHYTLDNIQFVCRIVNRMKSDTPQAEFIRWCKRITDASARNEDDLESAVNAASLS